tara:strand:+ start:1364 stop:3100 length:1737 start_codon:yes stop_codon:yes gene_type:complete
MASLAGATIASTFKSLLKLAGNTDDLAAASGSNAIQVKTGDDDATLLYLNTNKIGINTNEIGRIFEVKDTAAQLRLTQGTKYAEFFTTSDGDLQIVLNTAARNIKFDDNDKLMFGTSSTDETVYGDGNDLILTSGRDIYLTAASGRSVIMGADEKLQFGDATEYIMGDGDDLELYSGDDIYLTATDDIILNANGTSVGFYDDTQQYLRINHDTGNAGDAKFINGGGQLIFTLDDSADSLLMASDKKIEFGDAGTYIHQSADGVLDLVSDTELELNATTIDINGAVDISGTLTVGGNILGNVTIESTDGTTDAVAPELVLYRNADLTDNGDIGGIVFKGKNSNSDDFNYARMYAEIIDETDSTEDAALKFVTIKDGSEKIALNLYQGNCGFGGLSNPQVPVSVYTSGGSNSTCIKCWSSDSSVADTDIIIDLDYGSDADLDNGMFIRFQDSGGEIGSIDGDADATAYNTSSDYRKKTDLKDIVDAIGTINQLKLYDFAWVKNTSKRAFGVLAHEAAEIIPQAISGAKDAMTTKETQDSNGNVIVKNVMKPQSADYSKFVPHLLKAVQELSAKVTALENA